MPPARRPAPRNSSRTTRPDRVWKRIIAWTATQRGRRITLRYLGVAKNQAWLRNRAAAINLPTLVNAGLTRRDGAWAPA